MFDPWQYAKKFPTEHGSQVALFMWANMAANFGLSAANDVEAYSIKGNALANLNRYDDKIPQLKYLFAIHNQGNQFASQGARARAEGVKAGVPDICLPVNAIVNERYWNAHLGDEVIETLNYNGLYIELKTKATYKPGINKAQIIDKAAGKPSPEQLEWQTFLRDQGYVCEICYGWKEAKDVILNYLKEGSLI